MYDMLKRTSLFGDLDDEALRAIAGFSRKLECADGESILAEGGNQDRDLYIVSKGDLDVTSTISGWSSNKEISLPNINTELYGEVAWLLRINRIADAKCHGATELIRIDGDKLHAYLAAHPDTGFKVISKIATILDTKLVHLNTQVKMVSSYAF